MLPVNAAVENSEYDQGSEMQHPVSRESERRGSVPCRAGVPRAINVVYPAGIRVCRVNLQADTVYRGHRYPAVAP